MSKKLLAYILGFGVLILLFWGALALFTDTFNQSKLLKRGKVTRFSFLNQDGKDFTNHDIEGKVCVVEYFFTTCTSICPKMNTNMKDIYESFKNEPNFIILSHTCDPEIDSVPVLKRYADSLKVDAAKWAFLTGRKDSLYSMARYSYGIDDPNNKVANIDDDFLHSQFFALVDKDGNVRGQVYDGLIKEELDKLKSDIKDLLKEKQGKTVFVNGIFNNTP